MEVEAEKFECCVSWAGGTGEEALAVGNCTAEGRIVLNGRGQR